MPIDLVFATGNHAKLAQLSYVISILGVPIRPISAREAYGEAAIYEEVGATPSIITHRGALEVAKRIGVPVAVEDSSFHVDVMNGEPGIHAGKYLKEHGRQGILQAVGESSKRYAKIISAVTWATPEGDTQTWMQVVRGHIARREWVSRGMPDWVGPTPENPEGGGFNAIFIPYGDTRTFSEITPLEALSSGYREPNFGALIQFLRMRHRS